MYVGGLLFYSTGMFLMAVTRHKFSVIFFSWAAGVMYSTMFTMPYLLIAHYHSTNTVILKFTICTRLLCYYVTYEHACGSSTLRKKSNIIYKKNNFSFQFTENLGDKESDDQVRGLGTDVAVVSSMVFVAQFILSICMGTIVSLSGTTSAVVYTASFLAFCASIVATQVMYLDL